MKKVISILLIASMIFSLAACGGKTSEVSFSDDPNVGMWNGVIIALPDDVMDIYEMYQKGIFLELKSNGSYIINWDGSKNNGKWSYSDGVLILARKDGDFKGTIENGILKLINVLDIDMDITFEKEGGTAVAILPGDNTDGQDGDGKGLSKVQQWWDGEWFGYWETHSETDLYTDFEDGRWESYAVIEMNTDDTGTIYMWDENGDFANTNISVSEYGGQGDMGAAMSESGNLWFGAEIGHADWIIDPSIYGYENYMVIDGRYEDEFGGGFNYIFYLKPWGELWEGFEEDEKPLFYDTWYLTEYDKATMLEAILDHDGPIHTALADRIIAEKPTAEKPTTTPPVGNAATSGGGERIETGTFSAICPSGWKGFLVEDYFSKELDPDQLKIYKGAKTEDDFDYTPGLDMTYRKTDPSSGPPDNGYEGKSENWGPIELGGRIWNGYIGIDVNKAFIWTDNYDGGPTVYIFIEDLGTGGNKISLSDPDLQEILASIKYN